MNFHPSPSLCVPPTSSLWYKTGLILVDKPEGPTSHHVVRLVKRLLPKGYKVGHLGTLDPFASGLLPIMVGNATRLADELMATEKTYLFRVELGKQTTTLDPTGQVTREAAVPPHFQDDFDRVCENFRGAIWQTPPEYSALKVDGKPMYEYMRAQGKLPIEIESKRREIFIYSLMPTDFWKGQSGYTDTLSPSDVSSSSLHLDLEVQCSKGTYVRCLARDLAKGLGTVGYCSKLRRSAVGPWGIQQAVSVKDLETAESWETLTSKLITIDQLCPTFPILWASEEQSKALANGNRFFWDPAAACLPPFSPTTRDGWIKILEPSRKFGFLAKWELGSDENQILIKPYKQIL
jgi:tRNA pseudouridine55 synthase